MMYLLFLAGNPAKDASKSRYLASAPVLSCSHTYIFVCRFFFLIQTGMTALKQMIISFAEIKTPLKILVIDLRFLNGVGRTIFVCFAFV